MSVNPTFDMTKTGIFATEDEFKRLMEIANNAARTPCIAMSVADGLAGRDWASTTWNDVQQACHELAKSHGLPEIPGYYGIDKDKEFVRS